ncbi:MAG: hypothetical protein RL198_336 [Actinomycetota bacterium]
MSLAILAIGCVVLTSLAVLELNLRFTADKRAGLAAVIRNLLLAIIASGMLLTSATDWLIALFAPLALFVLPQLIGAKLAGRPIAEKVSRRLAWLLDAFSWLSRFMEARADSPEEIEQELIDSVEEFTETVVREVMVPRVDVEFLSAEDTLETALAQFISTGFSRLPVTGKSIDDVVGIAFLKDVARIAHEDSSRLAEELVSEVARLPHFVPESRSVAELLRDMQRGGIQMVVVSDEYGGVAGIATFEDLIEELVGDIADEYDRPTEEIQILNPDQIRVSPRLSLEELADTFGITIDESEVETVAGWLSKLLGRLPSGGERVVSDGLVLVAERVDARRNRIISILVSRDTALD